MKKTILIIMLAFTGLAAKAQTKPNLGRAIVWPKDSSIVSKNTGLFISTHTTWKPISFTWDGLNKTAMRIDAIDTDRKIWVHIYPKQIHWVNDSTFYIQHKP